MQRTCTCPDYQRRGVDCKHLIAAKRAEAGGERGERDDRTGVFDVDRRLLRFDSIHEVSTLGDGDDVATLDRRLDELSRLAAGWLDGEGVPPDTVVLQRARTVLRDLLNFDVPRPRVFATPEGGVQAEWTVESHEISVTFEPDGSLYAISVNVASGQTDEPELAADHPEQIAQFVLRSS